MLNVRPPFRRRGRSRRDFLKAGALGFSGLHLPGLLAAEKGSSERSCIVIFQAGGASQLDTFDPKPDAVSDIRGSFKAIPTAIPGVRFSELLPRSAKAAKSFSVIRSMHSDEAIHERARQYVFSGTKPRNEVLQPSFGATVARERGQRNGLPPFVAIPTADLSAEAGFLGPTYDPFVSGDPNTDDFSVKDLTLPGGVNLGEARSRAELLGALDREFQAVTHSPLISSMDEFHQKAFDLISSPVAKDAFDIGAEPDRVRDAYGRTTVGQGALLARRLIEAGVRLATVFHWGYDTHVRNEPTNKDLVPEFDQAFTGLLEDLKQRGAAADDACARHRGLRAHSQDQLLGRTRPLAQRILRGPGGRGDPRRQRDRRNGQACGTPGGPAGHGRGSGGHCLRGAGHQLPQELPRQRPPDRNQQGRASRPGTVGLNVATRSAARMHPRSHDR